VSIEIDLQLEIAMPPKKRELEEGGSSGGTPSSQAPALKKRCRSFDL
jgi:hypothetical protein